LFIKLNNAISYLRSDMLDVTLFLSPLFYSS